MFVNPRSIVEENLRVLLRRWEWTLHGQVSSVSMGTDAQAVLALLTEDEVKRAGDTTQPLFDLALDEIALANLANSPLDHSVDPANELIVEENEDVLFARWGAARSCEIQAMMVFGLSAGTVGWLKGATLRQLRQVARSGHPCVRLGVKPGYLHQAGRCAHLGQVQRTALALVCHKEAK